MIESYAFGRIIIDGVLYTRDIKIIRQKVIHPWWRKSGHSVAPEDIIDIIDAAPEMIIFGTGSSGMMTPEVGLIRLLRSKKIELLSMPTKEAGTLFNQLSHEKENIASGFHLTC